MGDPEVWFPGDGEGGGIPEDEGLLLVRKHQTTTLPCSKQEIRVQVYAGEKGTYMGIVRTLLSYTNGQYGCWKFTDCE